MGKKDKKKKGKGIEKTAAKTEKKRQQKLKKELAGLGEEDIEVLIAKCQEEGKRQLRVSEEIVSAPSPRVNFTLTPHPDKDELILFGGEYYNGSTTIMYNDVYFYCIRKKEWRLLTTPNPPTPRSAHQTVAVAQDGGQLWMFGGEFASPTENQFYHYRDLWVLHLKSRKWEKISEGGGPSARSGHRMVTLKRNILIFGGFHDNNTNYIYHNDVHVFSLDSYTWTKLQPAGIPPSPRSGCIMGSLSDGKVLVFGGYRREKVMKEDKGVIHQDMYLLTPDKHDESGMKWKWVTSKVSGFAPSLRCSMAQTVAPNNILWLFGGVYDQHDKDDDLASIFYNDIYKLDLNKGTFYQVSLSGKKDKKRKKKKVNKDAEMEEDAEEVEERLEAMELEDKAEASAFVEGPCGRMNSGLALNRGKLYVYGGTIEADDKTYTLDDMYVLDASKPSCWDCIQEATEKSRQWEADESESSDSSDSEEEEDDEMEEQEI